MRIFGRATPFYKRNTFILVSTFVALLITVRILLPSVLLKELNSYLAEFSPDYKVHISDLDLSLLLGAYRMEGIEAVLKQDNKKFLMVDTVEVSLAWRELLKGKVLTDIVTSGIDFHYTNALKDINFTANKKGAEEAKKKIFPVKITRLDIRKSKITMDDYPGIKPGEKLSANDVEGSLSNLTPDEKSPISFLNIKATLLDSAVLKTTGKLNFTTKPAKWDFDSEVLGFDLTTLNAFLKRKVPVTFTKGKLDLYAEAVSEDGKIKGYVKPFIKNLDVVKSNEDFKGPKHWAIEIISAVSNLILRASDSKSVATRIPFSFDKEFKVDVTAAAYKAIEHGFQEKLSPGIENKFEMKE